MQHWAVIRMDETCVKYNKANVSSNNKRFINNFPIKSMSVSNNYPSISKSKKKVLNGNKSKGVQASKDIRLLFNNVATVPQKNNRHYLIDRLENKPTLQTNSCPIKGNLSETKELEAGAGSTLNLNIDNGAT